MVDLDIEKAAENIDIELLDESEDEFSIGDFISENYEPLTVMGIFGAISVYLTKLSSTLSGVNKSVSKIGIVASFVLFIISSIPIFTELWEKVDQKSLSIPADSDRNQFVLILFFLSFSLLVSTISYMALSIPRAVTLLSSFMAFYLGWLSFTPIFNRLQIPKRGSGLRGFFYSFLLYILKGALLAIFLSVLPLLFLIVLFSNSGFSNFLPRFYTIIFTSQGTWFVAPVLSYFIGIGVTGLLALISTVRFLISFISEDEIDISSDVSTSTVESGEKLE